MSLCEPTVQFGFIFLKLQVYASSNVSVAYCTSRNSSMRDLYKMALPVIIQVLVCNPIFMSKITQIFQSDIAFKTKYAGQ